jgi:hypothetical protein
LISRNMPAFEQRLFSISRSCVLGKSAPLEMGAV